MRSRAFAAGLGIVLVSGAAIGAALGHDRGLVFVGGVPADVRALASATWEEFAHALAGRRDCFEPPALAVSWTMADRGSYDPETGIVTLRVPWTKANLKAALVHEWAHHVEFTCFQHPSLRAPFLRAEGLPTTTPWRRGGDWAATPSERYAEAAVVLVLGRPPHVTAGITSAEVAALARWARGD